MASRGHAVGSEINVLSKLAQKIPKLKLFERPAIENRKLPAKPSGKLCATFRERPGRKPPVFIGSCYR
jgi:hypothetical protein